MVKIVIDCNCTDKKFLFIDDELINSLENYSLDMEDFFFKKKIPENVLLEYFQRHPLPDLPFNPFSLNYFVFGIDVNNFYTPHLLSKSCQVLDCKINPNEFFGLEYINKLNTLELPSLETLISEKQIMEMNFSKYEKNLRNYFLYGENFSNNKNEFVSVHKVYTGTYTKSIVVSRGEQLPHKEAQLLHELNVIFFSYEFELIQQLRGKEKSSTELAKIQTKHIFTDWGLLYPYIFPPKNLTILEDQKKLRNMKFSKSS